MGKRGIDFHSFFGNALLLVFSKVFQGPHIVQTVRQFDQDNTDVLRHGHEHLAVVFSQLLFVRLVLDLTELGNSIDNHAHIRTKLSFQIVQGRISIFHHIMQETTSYCYSIQLEFG